MGKTTTVRVLAKEMGVELVEWGEAVEESSLGNGIGKSDECGLGDDLSVKRLKADRESPVAKISTFLARHSFSSLSLHAETPRNDKKRKSKPRVLFMTSLPNLSHAATKEAFHAALLDFCKSYSSHSSPLIIVHSDMGSGGRAEESWMDRNRDGREGPLEVLGREVKDSPWATEIE